MDILRDLSVPIGLLLFGALLACVGLLLLGEYRRAFFANPRGVISFEVFAQLAQLGGTPGYFGVLLLFCSAFFLVSGLVSVVVPWLFYAAHLWSTLFPSGG